MELECAGVVGILSEHDAHLLLGPVEVALLATHKGESDAPVEVVGREALDLVVVDQNVEIVLIFLGESLQVILVQTDRALIVT